MRSHDYEREERWAAQMTAGQPAAEEGGGCGGCSDDAPCEGCGTAKNDPTHQRLEWATMVANSKPDQTEFWRTATMADAFFQSIGGNVPDADSMITAAMWARQASVSQDAAITGQMGITASVSATRSQFNGASPAPSLVNEELLPPLPGYHVKVYPPGALSCCCPGSINIEPLKGNDDYGYHHPQSYPVPNTWNPSKKPVPSKPPRPGNQFEITYTLRWIPHERWIPCGYEWFERSNRPPQGWVQERKWTDMYKEAKAHVVNMEDARGLVTGPTHGFWHEHLTELKDTPETIKATDAPSADPNAPSSRGQTRDLDCEIRVTAGCPPGTCDQEVVTAHWSQRVTVGPNGEQEGTWFAEESGGQSILPKNTPGSDRWLSERPSVWARGAK